MTAARVLTEVTESILQCGEESLCDAHTGHPWPKPEPAGDA